MPVSDALLEIQRRLETLPEKRTTRLLHLRQWLLIVHPPSPLPLSPVVGIGPRRIGYLNDGAPVGKEEATKYRSRVAKFLHTKASARPDIDPWGPSLFAVFYCRKNTSIIWRGDVSA
jgi:hypothetical protein